MFKVFKRWWKYATAKLSGSFEERADPKVQLEQAIQEAQEQHRRLKEQAANMIAIRTQSEMRLNRDLDQLEKLNANARQAVLMADESQKGGDQGKANEYTAAAEAIANQLIALETSVEQEKQDLLKATDAANQAKAAVQQNSSMLQKKLSERNQLLGQLEQAKMQEQMNRAMTSLSETVGEDVPTLDEVRNKIEARYARAQGMSELQGQTVESRMLEIEQATASAAAQTRLAEIRAQLGLAPAAASAGEVGSSSSSAPTAEPAPAPAPGESPPAS